MTQADETCRNTNSPNSLAYLHHGFWQAMDTLRDKNRLEELWQTGRAPWKIWE